MATTLVELLDRERAAHATSTRAERTARRYLAAFLLPLIAVYVLPFAVERIPALQRFSASDLSRRLDYAYTLGGTDADVVIYGDSSALYGIDTPRLSRELGLKAVNLPQTLGGLVISGDVPLRRYLHSNRPPRAIVLATTPWNRDFRAASTTRLYEGIEQAIRHDSVAELLHVARRYPSQLAGFPLAFYLVQSGVTRPGKPADTVYGLMDGFEPYSSKHPVPLPAQCAFPAELLRSNTDTTIRQLRDDIDGARTVLVPVLSPVPRCNGVNRLRALFGPSLAVLPPGEFADDQLMAHLLKGRTDTNTDRVAAILRQELAVPGPVR